MSIDSFVNFLLSIENFPVSIVALVLNFAIIINTYIIHRKNKNQKPFYYYLITLLSSIFWTYVSLYFEPNIIVTYIRYAELIFKMIYLVYLLIIPNLLKKYI